MSLCLSLVFQKALETNNLQGLDSLETLPGNETYCWWFRNPVSVDMVVYPILYMVYVCQVVSRISEPSKRYTPPEV